MNFAFVPPTITIAVGTQVQWTNQDGFAHTVTADDASFHSDSLEHSETYSQTFNAAGTYSYHCSIHPFMKGKIVVQ
jgi:amicyanin